VAGTVVASAIIALIELLGLSNYHGPGYLPSCYFLASIIFSVAFIVFGAVKQGVEQWNKSRFAFSKRANKSLSTERQTNERQKRE
jgi:hypothetical protein